MEKKHTFSVLPILRQFQHSNKGEASVYVRITVDGKRSEISTKTIVPRDKWLQVVEGSREKAKNPAVKSVYYNFRTSNQGNFIAKG